MRKLQIELHHYDESGPEGAVRHQRSTTIAISRIQLLLSAITVGRANWQDISRFGLSSYFDIVQRVSQLLSNIETADLNHQLRLTRTERFHASDTSEKLAYSYWLGLAIAGLVASRLYGVRWLMHLDVYFKQHYVVLRGRSRPDLFGQTQSGSWVVVEAKGRSSGVDDEVRAQAKEQCRRILSINGATPSTLAGIISWFDRDDILNVDVVDPAFPTEDAIPLDFDPDWFVTWYYAPFASFLSDETTRREEIILHDRQFLIAHIPGSSFKVGLYSKIFLEFTREGISRADEILAEKSRRGIPGLYQRLLRILEGFTEASDPTRGNAVGRDGVVIIYQADAPSQE